MSSNFVHLSLHSEFSLRDSIIKIKPLMKNLSDKGMKSVALSDSSNMFGTIRFYQQAMANGVKPIISSEIIIADEHYMGKANLICKDLVGYKNLMKLISIGYDKPRPERESLPVYSLDEIKDLTDGLILLTGARSGQIGKALVEGKEGYADNQLKSLKKIFNNRVFIELQRTGHPNDDKYVHLAVDLAIANKTPVVATNEVRFLEQEDFKTHEIRLAIGKSTTVENLRKIDPLGTSSEQYLKTPEEMAELFSDIPSAISNTVVIAQGCNVDLSLNVNALPQFDTGDLDTPEFLNTKSREGLEKRLIQLFGDNNPDIENIRKEYDERLETELKIINEMGFPGYFLIVMEFIQWSKDNRIPVGPGRGSGAGSLVAYALKITDLDPLEYDLLFERFLNPERVSMPDFDVDFCMDRRDEVIKHTADTYGQKSVSQIVTFTTMAAKGVVRDTARALGYPYAVANRISQMIPKEPGIKLRDCLESDANFLDMYQQDEEAREIIDQSLLLEGIARQTGKHAGGVVIAPGALTDFTPTYAEPDGNGFVSQYDKNDVETAGLVKFDFLGLRTLTIIQWAVDAINERNTKEGKPLVDIDNIPLKDDAVFDMYSKGNTTAVFQVESRGMKELLKKMKPDCFEDLIALVALFRPGPLQSGMVDNFINRKHGREEISYPDANYQHECLKETLEPTYGIILYQEQVMRIAQEMSGYTLGGADMLRRAMGKKKPEEMAKQRSIFKEGAISQGVDPELSMKIFDLVEKFAGYGFNKSHSAAYALVSYQTAWLKVHYPSEFMAAVLSADMDNTDKVVNFIQECKAMDIDVIPPQLNISNRKFVASKPNEIVYGLEAVKGMGESVINRILDERDENGPYKSIHDLAARAKLDKRALTAAVKAGVMDDMGPNRNAMTIAIPKIIEIGKQTKVQNNNNQIDFFGSLIDDEEVVKFDSVDEWNDKFKLKCEKDTLGLFLSGHPLDVYENDLPSLITGKFSDFAETVMEDGDVQLEGERAVDEWKDKSATIAGYVVDIQHYTNKKGNTVRMTIDDKSRQMDVWVFSKTFNDCQQFLNIDDIIVIKGKITVDKKTKNHKMLAYNVIPLDMARDRGISHLLVNMEQNESLKDKTQKLSLMLKNQDSGHVRVNCRINKGEIDGKEQRVGNYSIKITDEFIFELKNLLGDDNVNLVYKSNDNDNSNNNSVNKADYDAERTRLKEEGIKTAEIRHALIAKNFMEARSAMGL